MQIQATRAVADNRATTRPQFAEILDRVRLAPSQRGKDGPPSLAWCLVPVRDVIVDHDSWNVSGLEGTRSKTVVINDSVFVPNHRVLEALRRELARLRYRRRSPRASFPKF